MSEKIARLVGAVAGLVLGAGIGLFVVFAVREFGGGAAVFVIGGGSVFLFLVTLLLYSAAAGSRARSVDE